MAAFDGSALLQIQSHLASGQAIRNSLHVVHASAGSPPDYTELLQLADDFWSYVGTEYRAMLPTGGTVDQILAKQVNDPTAPAVLIEAAFPVAEAGTLATSNEGAPEQACALLSLKTPNASRRFRGHMFMPPPLMARQQDGQIWDAAATYFTGVVAYAAKLQDGAGPTPSWTGSVLHNYILNIFSLAAATDAVAPFAEVQTVSASPAVRWLRSRGRGTT